MSDCIDHGQRGAVGGYGRVRFAGVVVGAHRAAYCRAMGLGLADIKSLVVRHTCDNPRCINQDHLLLGTASDNMQDRERGTHSVRGEGNPAVRLTQSEVAEIRRLATTGITQVAIARRFNIRQGYVSKIVNKVVWK